MRFIALILISFIGWQAMPTKDYPQDIFQSPVSYTLRLSGTFGELRPNHFHAGIDIKSPNGSVGAPILATADGYISRVKYSAYGYGRAVYITHPTGYTSVYAHLHAFSPEIEEYVKQKQYEQETFEIDITIPENQFRVIKGEQIGKLGNSGSSFGPHLHFEIRETASETPINPMLFGILAKDSKPPRFHALRAYALDSQGKELHATTKTIKRGKYGWYIGRDTIFINAEKVGLASKVYDHLDGAPNWNGIYKQELYIGDKLISSFTMDEIGFDETLYINAHMDYEDRIKNKSYYNKMYRMPGNKLSIYTLDGDGYIDLNSPKNCKLVASDLAGNQSVLSFVLAKNDAETPEMESYNYLLRHDEENMIQRNDLEVHFKNNTFYEPIELLYKTSIDNSAGVYSNVHHLHKPTVPIHSNFDLAIKPTTAIPDSLLSKAFIADCTNGKVYNRGGEWENGFLKTKVRNFGDYCIKLDLIPPTITPIRFGKNLSRNNYFSFKIDDNYDGNRGQLSYKAWVDGQWILLKFDKRKSQISHRFDGKIGKGTHQLKIVVTDGVGNETEYNASFVR